MPARPLARRRRRRDLLPWAMAALGGLFFVRPLLLGSTFYFRDLHLLFLPLKELMAQLWRAGVVPLWNPYLHGGVPLLGDPAAAGFYPSSLLYLLLPAVRAFNLELAGHVVLSALAAYALARTLGLHRAGAWTAAVVYGFCGVTLSQLNLYVRLLAMPFLPLVLLALHRHLSRGSRRWLLLAGAAAGAQVLAGAPEMVAITWLTALVWVLAMRYPVTPVRRLAAVATTAALGLALGAAQLLPLLALTRQSRRGGGLPFSAFATWSVPWRRLPELLLPGYFGTLDALDPRRYWGAGVVDQGFPYQPSLYLGLTAMLLAVGALGSRSQAAVPRRARLLLAALAGAALLLSLGRHLPGFELLYRALPPLRLFRFPEKLVLLAVLPVALGAGWSVHRVARGHARAVRRWVAAAAGAAALAAGALALLAAGAVSGRRLGLLLLARDEPAAAAHLAGVFARAAMLALALLLALALRRQGRRRQAYLLAAIVTADLLAAGRAVNPVTPARWFLAPPPALAGVRAATGGGRLYVEPRPAALAAPPGADAAWGFRRDRWVLAEYLAAAFRVRTIFHADFHSLAPSRTTLLGARVAALDADRRLPLLSAAAVRAVLAPAAGSPGDAEARRGLVAVALVPDPAGPPLAVLRNEVAAPRYRWVGSWRHATSPREALRAMLGRGYDSRLHVVVEDAKAGDRLAACPTPARLRVVEPTPNRAVVTLEAGCPGWLVVADSWADGWRYRLDGEPIAAVHADVAFAAVAVPAGSHRIERVYRPLPLALGALVSLLALVTMAWAARRSPAAARRTPAP